MREILFRGKITDTKEWIEGVAFPHDNNKVTMLSQHPMDGSLVGKEIDPETVVQFTGLTDKNGVKVFEGDVVRCVSRLDYANMIVIFEDGEFRMVKCEDYKTYTTGKGYFSVRCFHKEVIGNIYDNPELLGGVNDETD